MPTYTFEIIETGEQYDEMMKISEKDDYLKNNPPEPNWDGVWKMTIK